MTGTPGPVSSMGCGQVLPGKRGITRAVLNLAERWAPGLGAWLAAELCRKVPTTVPGPPEAWQGGTEQTLMPLAEARGRARRSQIVLTESLGRGRSVFLLPGYHGSGQMAGFARDLADAGFRAITITVPGSTGSGPGRYGPGILPDFTGALASAADCHGCPSAIVAHSMGALAALVDVLDGMQVTRLVLLEPAPNMEAAVEVIAWKAGLGPRISGRLARAVAQQDGRPLHEVDAVARACGQEAGFPPTLIIRDPSDHMVSLGGSRNIATALCKPRRTPGLMHGDILRSLQVRANVVTFLLEGRLATGHASRTLAGVTEGLSTDLLVHRSPVREPARTGI